MEETAKKLKEEKAKLKEEKPRTMNAEKLPEEKLQKRLLMILKYRTRNCRRNWQTVQTRTRLSLAYLQISYRLHLTRYWKL